MNLDEKIDEILGHLLGQSSAIFISHPKGKKIVMPAEEFYEYQIKAKEAITQLITEAYKQGYIDGSIKQFNQLF